MTFSEAATKSYWLPGDVHLDAHSPTVPQLVKATVVHSFLFDQPFAISDSALVSCKALRQAAKHDPVIREIVQRGFLRVARRIEGSGLTPLIEVCRKLDRKGRPDSYPSSEFLDESNLRVFEDQVVAERFSLDVAREHYATEMLSLFARASGSLLPEPVAQAALEAATMQREIDGFIDQEYLYYEDRLGADLDRRSGAGTWQQWGPRIQQLSGGPYVSFLGTALALNPVFSREHAESVALWRGRIQAERTPLDQPVRLRRRTDAASFTAGLLALSMDDLVMLRDGDEGVEFRAAMADLCLEQAARSRLVGAYHEYCGRLDEAIITKVLGSSKEGEQEMEFAVLSPAKRVAGLLLRHLAVSVVDVFTLNAASHLSKGVETVQTLRGQDALAEASERVQHAMRTSRVDDEVRRAQAEEHLRDAPGGTVLDREIVAHSHEMRDTLLDRQ